MDQEKAEFERWKHVLAAHNEEWSSFSRTIISLAGGALGLSVTFVQEVVPADADGSRSAKWALGAGWLALVLSLLAVVASYYTSGTAFYDDLDDPTADPAKSKWDRWTDWANIASGVCLAVGLGLLGIFAYLNL